VHLYIYDIIIRDIVFVDIPPVQYRYIYARVMYININTQHAHTIAGTNSVVGDGYGRSREGPEE